MDILDPCSRPSSCPPRRSAASRPYRPRKCALVSYWCRSLGRKVSLRLSSISWEHELFGDRTVHGAQQNQLFSVFRFKSPPSSLEGPPEVDPYARYWVPVVPCCMTQPMTTSSTSPPSVGAPRCTIRTTYPAAIFEKSGLRRSANAANASRASAVCKRSRNKPASRVICAALLHISRSSAWV